MNYEELQDEIEEYMHGSRRYIRLTKTGIEDVEILRCEHCNSGWNESKTQPGTCTNCGAPKPHITKHHRAPESRLVAHMGNDRLLKVIELPSTEIDDE